ncbi:DUF4142 domain-containing protein [Frigidibacter sp. MR17.24]|uniref:DUF4142 domain-containing protein n=1 Tax=Frigidibacter sp. MR17.24 TaxID=3127345 RepID=UPI00301300CC
MPIIRRTRHAQFVIAILMTVLICAEASFAQSPDPPSIGAYDAPILEGARNAPQDADSLLGFVEQMSSYLQLQIRASHLALAQSGDPALRQLARDTLSLHEKFEHRLALLADDTDIPLPEGLLRKDAVDLYTLRAAELGQPSYGTPAASPFDRSYMDLEARIIAQVTGLMAAAADGGAAPVAEFARSLQRDLSLLKRKFDGYRRPGD